MAFVAFKDGKPAGKAENVLTGFLANDKEAYGRPVGVAWPPMGVLVADKPGNAVWRMSIEGEPPLIFCMLHLFAEHATKSSYASIPSSRYPPMTNKSLGSDK